MVGYLDTSVVLMDLLSREAQPEAIKRALTAVEKASQDQAAAAARIPRLTLVLNTATLIITAVLGIAIGVLVMVLHQTHIDQERAKAPAARLARDLATIGGSLDYDVSPVRPLHHVPSFSGSNLEGAERSNGRARYGRHHTLRTQLG